ncbi:MAG: hypothetical protein CMM52_13420 [Rhodospirillaceae bacterium]|nr:hypothetical protein [Rhodospirillaceae bacterium]
MGLVILGVGSVFVAISFIYELIETPTDLHLPGLISAIAIRYLAPMGLVFVVLGSVGMVASRIRERQPK